jgi:hypothetical protein
MTVVDDAAPSGSLEALSSAFDVQIATLRQVAGLRCSDMMAHAADLGELEVQADSSHCTVRSELTSRIRRRHACGLACHLSVWYLLRWMQATVQTLEHSLQQIQAAVARERLQIPKVVGVHDKDASFRLHLGPQVHAAL